jgi:hypothetical protein
MSVVMVLPVPPVPPGCLLAAVALTFASSSKKIRLLRGKTSRGAFRVRGKPEKFRYTPPARGAP